MEYTVHTPQQLGLVLQGQRKSKRMTQKAAGAAVGLLPKTVSALESSPQRAKVDSLFKLLSALELELVLRPKPTAGELPTTPEW